MSNPATGTDRRKRPLACRLLGCSWHFSVRGRTLEWDCVRAACPAEGSRTYSVEADAVRMAIRLNRGGPAASIRPLEMLSGVLRRPRR